MLINQKGLTVMKCFERHIQTTLIRLRGWIEHHWPRLCTFHGVSSTLTYGVKRHVARMIVVNQVTQHTAIWERHCEILHLIGKTIADLMN